MNKNEFIRSSIIDEILEQLLKHKQINPKMIEKMYQVPRWKSVILYQEYENYHDEVFLHNCLYELSFKEEPATIARVMRKFNVSYTLAKRIYEFYMENI